MSCFQRVPLDSNSIDQLYDLEESTRALNNRLAALPVSGKMMRKAVVRVHEELVELSFDATYAARNPTLPCNFEMLWESLTARFACMEKMIGEMEELANSKV